MRNLTNTGLILLSCILVLVAGSFVQDMYSYGYPPRWQAEPPSHLARFGMLRETENGTYRLWLTNTFGERAVIEINDCKVISEFYEVSFNERPVSRNSKVMNGQQCQAFLRQLYATGVFNSAPSTRIVDDGVHAAFESRISGSYIYWDSGDWDTPVYEITQAFIDACQTDCLGMTTTILGKVNSRGT